MQFLVTTTTTTHVLLPKGRHTAARQRVKAARQFSGWSPAARLSRSPRSSASDPPAHKWLAKIFVMPPTLLSLPLHVAQHHSRGTARDEVLTLPSRPHCPRRGTHTSLAPSLTPPCEVLGFSSPPCIAWSVSIAYPKKDEPRPHGTPQAGHLRRPILQFNSPKQVQARLPDQCWAIPPAEHWHSPALGLVVR